jgi:Apea-like HEPN
MDHFKHIPANDAFEAFISGCHITREKPDSSFIPLSPLGDLTFGGTALPQVFLVYPEAGIKVDSVLKKIADFYARQNCPTSHHLSVATLALLAATRDAASGAVTHSNRCFSSTASGRLLQYIIFPGRPRHDYAARVGRYLIKPFDAEKLLYWAAKCKSTFPVDLREFSGWATLERTFEEVSIVDWTGEGRGKSLLVNVGQQIASYLIDNYFSEMAHAYAMSAKVDLKKDALLLESSGWSWIGIEELLSTLLLKQVSYFTWAIQSTNAGWATFSDQRGLHFNFMPPRVFEDCREWMKDKLGFVESLSPSPFDQSIQTYCTFLQRAHGHRLQGRQDEAFLHFAIALDLLLGSEGRSQESVTERSALLVHRQFLLSVDQQAQAMKRLYNARSKYVHEGTSVIDKDALEIESVCTQVLWTLLACASIGAVRDVDNWLAKIDYLNAARHAGKTLAEDELKAVGVPPDGDRRQTPRVLDVANSDEDDFSSRRSYS